VAALVHGWLAAPASAQLWTWMIRNPLE